MKKFLLRSLFTASLAGALMLPATDADAALKAYLKLNGSKSGAIKGSIATKGQEGKIRVIAVSHEIVSPRDAASGLPTGKRQHKPLKLTIEVDKSMPLLQNALVSNENLTEFELAFWAPSAVGVAGGTGKEVWLYTIKLTNANISAAALAMAPGDDKATMEVSFTYQRIEWTWNDGGITAMDDWEAMQGAGAPKKPAPPKKPALPKKPN